MSGSLLTNLAWLPRAPTDFREQLRALSRSEKPGNELQRLAQYALNGNQLAALARCVTELRVQNKDLAPLQPLRFAMVSNSTTALITPAIVASALRHGILLDVIDTDYGQAVQHSIDPQSPLNKARPEIVLVSLNWNGLPLRCSLGDVEAAAGAVNEALGLVKTIGEGIRGACGATVIFETVGRPPELLFGSCDLRIPGTTRYLADAFNRRLVESLSGTPHLLLDSAGLAETVGLADWHDLTQWYLAKLPFAQSVVPLYGDYVARLLAAARGKSRRCLVLDLDNTLWGGIIGDDGLAGIVLGQGSPEGEAYSGIQTTALTLRDRGIVLAISSKNEDSTARLPFRDHPDMLLKEDHIAVFQANWNDKASNLRAIAETLSLGLDSLVLLDDNPAEREQVRQALPEVAVPELPEDPSLFARTILASGYFEAVAFSDEDRARADYYQANAARAVVLEGSADLQAFLTSLDMTITFSPFDSVGRDRISQLINKSNQFNLTTRRYSPAEVEAFEKNASYFTLQIRLSDRFGDNGMICVIICKRGATVWEIDTWLMSCRVLGRKVEQAVLQEIARHARSAGAGRLLGRYIPTSRNAMVMDHYEKLGFVLESQHADGSAEWSLDLNGIEEIDLPMQVRRTERDLVSA